MAKSKRSFDARIFILIPIALVAVIVAFVAQYKWLPRQGAMVSGDQTAVPVSEISNAGGVRISEVMTANKSAWADDDGKYSDWVELFNASGSPVDITGWTLTDKVDRLLPFTFPETVLESGQYLLVYCSDSQKQTPGFAYHAPFKLSSTGDSVLLFNASGSIVESVNVPAMEPNQSYARQNGGAFAVTSEYTPGKANTSENYALLQDSSRTSESPVVLNEVMADNATYIRDADGDYCDWVEMHNTSSEAVSVANYYLSDDEGNLFKWRFPDATIAPDGYLIVYCSGKNRTEGELHASFKLSGEGETVLLTDATGALVDKMQYELLKPDVSCSRTASGTWTKDLPPTPGYANTGEGVAMTERDFRAYNTVGVVLNEAITSAHTANSVKKRVDWVELFNGTDQSVDLSGYGLSDDPAQPRKWQFPDGAYISPGQYLAVACSGEDKSDNKTQAYKTNFSLSFSGEETVTLSTPEGVVLDRIPLMGQRGGVSYGRVQGRDGFFYFAESTCGTANITAACSGVAPEAEFSVAGGIYDSGTTLNVTLSSPSGVIHYTTDCSEPDESSPVYTAPISVNSVTVLRARVYQKDFLPSLTSTQSYLIGVQHTLPVMSVVTDPDYLFDDKIGIYIAGEGNTKLVSRNYWKTWERAGNAEYFVDGQTVFSQGLGLQLQGQYSRQLDQKGFKLLARNAYGKNTIEGKLFPHLDYTSFDSVILRASGQDNNKLRFRDAMLTSLASSTTVLYQDAQPVIVYLNGQYWGHYNLRERTNSAFIARHMGWKYKEKIDLVKANSNTLQGSDETFQSLIAWVKKNGCVSDENVQYVEKYVDVDNYLEYIALQMYIGNTDLLNVKRYRSDEGDGRWRWVLFDVDTAFIFNTDSYTRWLNPDGAGSSNKYDNTLFVNLMKNNGVKERFWRTLNKIMSTWTSEKLIEMTDEWVAVLRPEMEMQFNRWGDTMRSWGKSYATFLGRVKERPLNLLKFIASKTGMNQERLRVYFGETMAHLGL